jgi:ferric-dicitrate binding protein FerR (iron transport regulator)
MEFKDDKQLDDQLADFVDELMDGQEPPLAEDDDLRELERKTSMIWETFGDEEPDQAMSQRIWENLELEWQEKHQQKDTPIIPFGRRFRSYTSALAAAAAVAVLIFAALFIVGNGEADIPGSALGAGNVVLPVVLLALLGVAIYIYSKREG